MSGGEHVETAPHELRATLWYPGTLAPYWALSGAMLGSPFEGNDEFTVEIETVDGVETWRYEVYYQQGKIEPADRFSLDTDSMYEWRLVGRGHGERKCSFHVRPRFEGMNISTPWSALWPSLRDDPGEDPEGVDIDVNASNVEPDDVPYILREVVEQICDEAGQRFAQKHLEPVRIDGFHSGISQYERYVRLTRNYSSTLTHEGGYFWRLMHLLGTEKGAKLEYRVDNSKIVGYNHRLLLPTGAARQLPGQKYGKQLKNYQPEHVREKDDSDPLYHPKFGALFKKGKAPDSDTVRLNKHSVSWENRHELTRELEETIVNTLEHSGVPTDAAVAFVTDDHFEATTTNRALELYPDPTPEMELEQQSVIIRTLSNASDSRKEVLGVLADGGETHYREIADETGRDVSTVYRALDELGDLVENENGHVRFIGRKVAEEVRNVIKPTEQQVDAALKAAGELLQMDDRTLSKLSASMQKWLARYAAEVVDDDSGRLRLKIESVLSRHVSGSFPWAPEVLEEGLDAWVATGGNERDFREALVEFTTPAGSTDQSKVSVLLDAFTNRQRRREANGIVD